MPLRRRQSGRKNITSTMKVTVTGGRGFIGSHFVEEALKKGWKIHDIDKMGYASHRRLPWDRHSNYSLTHGNIASIRHIPTCDILINFAIVYAASAIVYIGIITCLVASSKAAVSRSRSRDHGRSEGSDSPQSSSSLSLTFKR